MSWLDKFFGIMPNEAPQGGQSAETQATNPSTSDRQLPGPDNKVVIVPLDHWLKLTAAYHQTLLDQLAVGTNAEWVTTQYRAAREIENEVRASEMTRQG